MKYVAIGYMTVEWRTFEKTAKYSIENIFDCDIYDGDIIEINDDKIFINSRNWSHMPQNVVKQIITNPKIITVPDDFQKLTYEMLTILTA